MTLTREQVLARIAWHEQKAANHLAIRQRFEKQLVTATITRAEVQAQIEIHDAELLGHQVDLEALKAWLTSQDLELPPGKP